MNQVVEAVFLGEKITQGRVTGHSCLVEEPNVAPCAKGTKCAVLVSAPDRDRLDVDIIAPGQQAICQQSHHLQAQRIECFGAVQGDEADPAADFCEDG